MRQGVVAPLDSYVTPEFKGALHRHVPDPSIMDGKVYGLPIAASARAMYYNKDVLKKAGYDMLPTTWADFKTAAEKIKATGGGVFPFGLQGKEIETDVYYLLRPVVLRRRDHQERQVGLDSPAAIEAATLYKGFIDGGLTEPGVTSYSREDVQNLFKQGRVGDRHLGALPGGPDEEGSPDLSYGMRPISCGTPRPRHRRGDRFHGACSRTPRPRPPPGNSWTSCSPTRARRLRPGRGLFARNAEEAKNPLFADDPI